MSGELGEVAQIIRVEYEGVELLLRIGSGGLKACIKTAAFLFGMLDLEKRQGKTSMRNMLKKETNLQVVKIDESQVKDAMKLFNKYGILYSKIPDGDKTDSYKEFIVPTSRVPQVNSVLERLGKGMIESVDDYLENESNEKLESVYSQLNVDKDVTDRVLAEESQEYKVVEKTTKEQESLMMPMAEYMSEHKEFSKEDVKEHFGISDTRLDSVLENMSTMGALKIREDGTYEAIMDKDEISDRIKEYQKTASKLNPNEAKSDQLEKTMKMAKEKALKEKKVKEIAASVKAKTR